MEKTSITRRNQTHGNMKTSKRADLIFEKSGLAKAPSKDFFSLSILKEFVVWRSWRITLRNNTSLPSETIQSWRQFVHSSDGARLQSEIKRVFGEDTVSYVLSLAAQSWLPFLRNDILVEIIAQLDLHEIGRLAQVRF